MTDEQPEYPASRSEVALLSTGLLIFIASFLPWYAQSFEGGAAEEGVTGTYNAWHGVAAVGVLLVLFSLVVTAAGPLLGDKAPIRPLAIASAALACIGAGLIVVRSFDLPSLDIPGTTATLRWGGWILIVLVLVHALISVLHAIHARDAR